MRWCQIQTHNDLAVNKMDKIHEELPIIHQQLKAKLHHCTTQPLRSDIVRLPLQLYLFCKHIFKRQKEVNAYLLQLFLSELYVKDIKKALIETQQDTTSDPKEQSEIRQSYMGMLLACKDNVTIYLSQLFLRFCILGVAVRVGEQRREAVLHRMKALVKQLQLELLISGSASFSDVVEAELQVIGEEFGCLQFYEGLREALDKCNTFHVKEWIENALQERRKQFQQGLRTPLEGRTQRKDFQKNVSKQKRVTISLANLDKENGSSSTQSVTSQAKQEPTVKPLTVSEIAAKMRKSAGPTPFTSSLMPKMRHTFVYRSSRKFSSQEQTAPEPHSQPELSDQSPIKGQKYERSQEKPHQMMNQSQNRLPSEPVIADCKALCDETPPRTGRKYVQ